MCHREAAAYLCTKNCGMNVNVDALMDAQGCYAAMERFRRDRERNKKFNYGDQWGDTLHMGGRTLTEQEYMDEQGSVPLKNNLIRRLVRNVIGVYCSQDNEPLCVARDKAEAPLARTMTTLLRYNGELNRLQSLYVRTLEEFMISGLAVHRKWYGTRGGRTDCWTDTVQPGCFFIDSNMRDFRAWDCRCVGEVHDVSFEDVLMQFAHSAEDVKALEAVYGRGGSAPSLRGDFGYCDGGGMGGCRPGLCRVIEVWRKEGSRYYACHDPEQGTAMAVAPGEYAHRVEAENRRRGKQGRPQIASRWVATEKWRYYFLSPQGHVLAEGDSPYAHGGHPYVVKAYPLIDGEIHAFVADVIDQQKYANRLITTYDWIIRASAKGVLMIPEDCIPMGTDPADFADIWSRFNGVLIYRPSMTGQVPHQVASNSTNVGITELLNIQLKMFEDISGVHGALEGQLANRNMSAELYNSQVSTATSSLQDLLGTFAEFMRDAAYMDVSNIQQFYGNDRIAAIAGSEESIDPEGLRTAEFDLSITPATSTAASRQASNKLLMEIWKSGQISLRDMLMAGDFPFADALLAADKTANKMNDNEIHNQGN